VKILRYIFEFGDSLIVNKLRISLLILFLIAQGALNAFASPNGTEFTRQEYIDRWKVTALKNMFEHNIPASITLAQGILESGNGNSTLTRVANNHFGIKCHGWNGPGYYMDDDKKDECFRVYKNAEESFEDHSQFLLKSRYADLFTLKITDYKGWAKGLKKAGYATHPEYAKRLIKIIEDNKLYEYDSYSYEEYLALKSKSKYAQEEDLMAGKDLKVKKKSSPASKGSDEVLFTKGRKIMTHSNNINYVIAKEGDDYQSIALDLNLGRWQILKYNDLEKQDRIHEGDVIFIQPKHNKSKSKSYTASNGDTWWSISQKYGLKMSKLLKHNEATSDQPIKPGQKINLR
jgi:LysM repeat protein